MLSNERVALFEGTAARSLLSTIFHRSKRNQQTMNPSSTMSFHQNGDFQPFDEAAGIVTTKCEETMDTAESAHKRPRQSIVHDLLCPITKELPFEPVMAEDGRIYEKSAIQTHFKDTPGTIKSPVTNMTMGTTLHSSHPIKNIIETSIENEDIPADLASTWLQRKADQDQMNAWRQGALEGSEGSAVNLALCYQFGTHGVQQDYQEAVPWWKMAAAKGNLLGMQQYGDYLMRGHSQGVFDPMFSDDHVYGTSLLYEAAAGGSALACLAIGMAYAGYGNHPHLRLPQNEMLALKWLHKGLDYTACVKLAIEPTIEYRNQCVAVLAALMGTP